MNCARSLNDTSTHSAHIISDDPKQIICDQCIEHTDDQSTDHGQEINMTKSIKMKKRSSISFKSDPYESNNRLVVESEEGDNCPYSIDTISSIKDSAALLFGSGCD